MVKRCSNCHEERDGAAFYPDPSKPSGLSSRCRECTKAASRKRWETHHEECMAYGKAYYQANKGLFLAAARRLREDVLREYGGVCKCCGEKQPEFLAIDHVNNDGESHRRQIGAYGRSIYRWLKTQGFPRDGFQLLCHNCNMAKGLYGGCPHQGPSPGKRGKTKTFTIPA